MKKRPYLHADAHVLARARLTPEDFDSIDASVPDHINAINAHTTAPRSARSGARTHRSRCAPLSNTGGKIELVCDDGKIKQVIPRSHYDSEHCFVDWVQFTVHEDTFQILEGGVVDQEIMMAASLACESIFGFGITSKRDKGMHFYRTSYNLGDKYGFVCYGGQRNTVHFVLNGSGCAAARRGWERRLFDFLESSMNAGITRIDLAHDDIKGELYTVDDLDKAYDDGKFNNGGRDPNIEHRGNWKKPNGKGRTIYIGNRNNGRYFRGYEKGKQLGDPNSPWVRMEVEFKSVDRIVPFDILKRPQDYYAAAYPILATFSHDLKRIHTIQKTTQISYERTKRWLKRQCGPALNLMLDIEGSPKAVLDMIIREGKLPKGVLPPSFKYTGHQLHHDKLEHMPVSLSFLSS
ncbi:hypothetical protein A7981_08490 [Methylovorus sp. MM2]|uniref:replication initiation factor domain-containing protein n=1 Tax=Methylovorus sp. MM2 TaxID=1848038 RepID=UPI0007E261DE|nr:replication initiation factor domain-containing protein [Methylovorus sp. MM2]OAM51518.1 hypothetical protein A7981_08490 [Methylovorus sp. MM2]